MLMIRESDLRAVLDKYRTQIGVRPLWDSILIFITGVFYIPAAWAVSNAICKWMMLGFGLLVTGYGAYEIVEHVRHRFTAEILYKEIAGMKMISSSIVAIRQPGVPDSNKYLLYYDSGWDCWFFPNRHSTPNIQDDKRDLGNFLNVEFKIPMQDCELTMRGTEESTKYSTAHDEERHYLYRIYLGDVQTLPEHWALDGEFEVGGHRCKWMTIAEMLADERIHDVNYDVVTAVRDDL